MLFFYLIVLIAAADIGAYFGGRSLGRRKLAPTGQPGQDLGRSLRPGWQVQYWRPCSAAMVFDLPVPTWLAACVPVVAAVR